MRLPVLMLIYSWIRHALMSTGGKDVNGNDENDGIVELFVGYMQLFIDMAVTNSKNNCNGISSM